MSKEDGNQLRRRRLALSMAVVATGLGVAAALPGDTGSSQSAPLESAPPGPINVEALNAEDRLTYVLNEAGDRVTCGDGSSLQVDATEVEPPSPSNVVRTYTEKWVDGVRVTGEVATNVGPSPTLRCSTEGEAVWVPKEIGLEHPHVAPDRFQAP